jgi:uncharacterized membrane-anchored protein YhcB (DUF1043 family)
MADGVTAWQWVLACFAFGSGVLVGILVAQAIGRRRDRHSGLRTELARVKAEHQAYRNEVYAHFAKTAELFQEMTDTYRNQVTPRTPPRATGPTSLPARVLSVPQSRPRR